jgi:hypothetical protein
MKLNELPDWPPKWQPLLLRSPKFVTGEIGILRSVRPINLSDDYLELRVEHECIEYIGVLCVNPIPSTQLNLVLEQQKGRSTKDIGNHEICVEHYRNLLIMADAEYLHLTRKWAATASIGWANKAGDRETKILTDLLYRSDSRESAIDFALAVAKRWVDNRVQKEPG